MTSTSPLWTPNGGGLGDLVRAGAMRAPIRTAVALRGGREETYIELDRRTDDLAKSFLNRGLVPGDRVAAWMHDSVEYVELLFSVAKAGLVLVPINARLSAREAGIILEDCEAKALVIDPEFIDSTKEIDSTGTVEHRVATMTDPPGGFEPFERLIDGSNAELPKPSPFDPVVLGYTSGTTGTPKGAVLTHGSLRNAAVINALTLRLNLGSTAAFSGSLSFVSTIGAHLLPHFLVGGTVVLMGSWQLRDLRHVVEKRSAGFTYIPTPRLREFADELEANPTSWSSLDAIMHGGSRAEPSDIESIVNLVGARFIEGWGMTEVSGAMVTSTAGIDPEGPLAEDLFSSVGLPTVDSAVRAVDVEDPSVDVADGDIGELVVASRSLMARYWRDEKATNAAIQDGWYRTGDLGRISSDGKVYVTDRRSDLIISGGMNVYPREVESWLLDHPMVRECAIVGVPHERWGQTVAAVVVASNKKLTSDEVVAWCRKGMASYKKPTIVDFRSSLPKTPTNKIRRNVLRDELARQHGASR